MSISELTWLRRGSLTLSSAKEAVAFSFSFWRGLKRSEEVLGGCGSDASLRSAWRLCFQGTCVSKVWILVISHGHPLPTLHLLDVVSLMWMKACGCTVGGWVNTNSSRRNHRSIFLCCHSLPRISNILGIVTRGTHYARNWFSYFLFYIFIYFTNIYRFCLLPAGMNPRCSLS